MELFKFLLSKWISSVDSSGIFRAQSNIYDGAFFAKIIFFR